MTQQEEFAQALRNRSGFYRMLAGFYFKPLTQEQIDTMAQADFSAFDFDDEEMRQGFHDIEHFLRKRNSGTRSKLAVDFTSAFLGAHVYQGLSAVPYESVHVSKQKLMMQESRASVLAEYKAQALRVRHFSDTPEDHLSFELEYMAVLSDRSARALEEGECAEALRNILLQQAFLRGHITNWFDAFKEVALGILETRFYRGVLRVTGAFIRLDGEFLADAASEAADLAGLDAAEVSLEAPQAWIERYEREAVESSKAAPEPFSTLKLW